MFILFRVSPEALPLSGAQSVISDIIDHELGKKNYFYRGIATLMITSVHFLLLYSCALAVMLDIGTDSQAWNRIDPQTRPQISFQSFN